MGKPSTGCGSKRPLEKAVATVPPPGIRIPLSRSRPKGYLAGPMSDLATRIPEDLKAAMKAKDTVALAVIRALKTAMTNAAIEKGGLGTVLDDAEVTVLIRKQIKQRQDSLSQFTAAGRTELAATEAAEITVLEKYLPAALSDEEITALVDAVVAESGASSKADMGKVMKLAQERAEGRADGKKLSQEVAKRLS